MAPPHRLETLILRKSRMDQSDIQENLSKNLQTTWRQMLRDRGQLPTQRRRGTSNLAQQEAGQGEGPESVLGRGNSLGKCLEAGGSLEGLEKGKSFRMAAICVHPGVCTRMHACACVFTHVLVCTCVVCMCRRTLG